MFNESPIFYSKKTLNLMYNDWGSKLIKKKLFDT